MYLISSTSFLLYQQLNFRTLKLELRLELKITFQNLTSQTCIKRSPLGQRKSGLLRQVTSYKRFNSYEIFYDSTRQR